MAAGMATFSHHLHNGTSAYDALVAPPYELVPSPVSYPFYHFHRASVLSWISDKDLSLLVPLVVYWGVSLIFQLIDTLEIPHFEKYRIHEPEEVKRKNRVTKTQVIIAVLVQQALQTALGLYALEDESMKEVFRDHKGEMEVYGAWISRISFALLGPAMASRLLRYCGSELTRWTYWWGVPIAQFLWASFVLDTWQYFLHRYFHTNKFLYKHIHSLHHRLYCPYAFGALYNHPVEGFLLDTVGTVIAHSASFMSTRQAIILFGFSTLKTVDDHCGFALPYDPLQMLFGNNVAYHDIHHQQFGIKKNFSQPYFTHWDVLLKTRMTSEQVPMRIRERYRAGPCKVGKRGDVDVVKTVEEVEILQPLSSKEE
ncbi:hypothetical protein BT93_L5818 [Corymbia citriodora subsp. variegata]|uniref:Fatty acid hydroxylase domain-containing protein n=1 Tax=Corymbia citriodora subsp. variegata TaxID=360336 RepID=A0A8T0CJH1_CORYI|nr:hypothetical protein BT93_L5818 [Corymbia citriodora subsp. variegata]